MRQLIQNKQNLYYSNYIGEVPIYALDSAGNVLETEVDGTKEPVIDSYKASYGAAVQFLANISFNSGETRMAEYGLNEGDYNAIISADKGKLPFNEQTLIWHTSEPEYDNEEFVIPESADYRVVAIKTSLNEERFILRKLVKGGDATIPSV